MTHFYFKHGQLKMYSQGLIDAPDLEHVEILITPNDEVKLKQNCPVSLKNGILEFGNPTVLEPADVTARRNLVGDLKNEVAKLKDKSAVSKEDLQNILNLISV